MQIPQIIIIAETENKAAHLEAFKKWKGKNEFPDPDFLTVEEFKASGKNVRDWVVQCPIDLMDLLPVPADTKAMALKAYHAQKALPELKVVKENVGQKKDRNRLTNFKPRKKRRK